MNVAAVTVKVAAEVEVTAEVKVTAKDEDAEVVKVADNGRTVVKVADKGKAAGEDAVSRILNYTLRRSLNI